MTRNRMFEIETLENNKSFIKFVCWGCTWGQSNKYEVKLHVAYETLIGKINLSNGLCN